MFIENSDAFKVWLTSVLEPLCDADPEALAKYVFALVKKDKPLEELRECMIEQLDVFLQSETKPFVELLFKTLDTQDYLNNSHVIPNTNPPNPNTTNTIVVKRDLVETSPKSETLVVKEIKPIIPVCTLPNLSEAINGAVAPLKLKNDDTTATTTTTTVDAVTTTTVSASSTSVKRERDRGDRDREVRKSDSNRTSTRHRSSSRNRSRSRSWDRSGKRSRSRDRSPRIERRDRSRPWRNKSPPRRYDRDRRRSRSGGSPRIRSRSRSPRHSSYRIGGRYRNRSPPQRSISRSRSRSRSNERTGSSSIVQRQEKLDNKAKDDNNSGGATPTQDSNHGDTDMRLINTTQSIQSVVSAGEGFKRRCRDFDEKGYCMRGEMCPYDHGVDPVVLEDTALSRVLTFGPNGAPPDGVPPQTSSTGGATASSAGGTVAVPPGGLLNPQMVGGMLGVVMPPGVGAFHQRGGGGGGGGGTNMIEYNPSAPGMLYHHQHQHQHQQHQQHHRPGFRGRGPPPQLRGGVVQGAQNNNNNNNNGGPPFGQSIQRELISVPVMDGPNVGYKRRSDYPGGPHDANVPMKKRAGGFDFARLGPRHGHGQGQLPPNSMKNPGANCSLELKKVPRGLNNITHLNNHFGKFGKIVNIQVCFEGDPEGAIVTFSSHAEANAAYRSTEAVLNNRFIKVFWHLMTAENIPPSMNNGQQQQQQLQQRGSAKERLGLNTNKVLNLLQPKVTDENDEPQYQNNNIINNNNNNNNTTMAMAMTTSTTMTTTTTAATTTTTTSNNNNNNKKSNVYVPSLVKKQQEQQKEDSKALANAAIVKNQEILAAKEQLKKKHEEKRKEALKITQDLRKRKQELLEKQLAQQKLLIEKLEKTNPSGQQRELLMSTIKTVQESIESIRKDMLSQTVVPASMVMGMGMAGPLTPRKSKEEAQREVLDAELDLITRQQEGGDTSELQRRLLELRAQAYHLTKSVGIAPIGGGGGIGGGISRRGRGTLRGQRGHHHPHFHLMSKNNMTLDNTIKRTTIAAAAASSSSSTNTTTTIAAAAGITSAPTNNNKKTVIDHRPTRLLVSGYEADEYESVLAHFSQYGEICEYVLDDSTPSIILSYRSRKEAEIALLKGKHFQDRTLSITWCTDIQYTSVQRAANSKTVTLVVVVVNEQPEQQQQQSPTIATATTPPQTTIEAETITPTSTIQTNKTNKTSQVGDDDDNDDDDNDDDDNGDEDVSNKTTTLNTTEDQLLEGDDENISGEQLGTELSEEVLLQDDEEDLEEDEERSWRR